MNSIKKSDIVRLHSGETCQIIGLPGSFMSNGSYEVIEVDPTVDGKYIPIKNSVKTVKGLEVRYSKPLWIKPNDIAYSLTTTDGLDPITNYFETVYGEEGEIHIIPKDLQSVELVNEGGFKTIKLIYDGQRHNTINILLGENEIKNINNEIK